MSLNTLRADVRRDDLLREARRARLAGNDARRESLFRRAIARLYGTPCAAAGAYGRAGHSLGDDAARLGVS